MILTGEEIKNGVGLHEITIMPFNLKQINPNSYNYRLGTYLKEFVKMDNNKPVFRKIILDKNGFLLKPNTLYLGSTFETLGSEKYAMSLIGKSSIGRLGVYVQLSANLGHTASVHNWTLEIYALKPTIVYPEMLFGQISFWENSGPINGYTGEYAEQNVPFESNLIL
jgi:dCTP deaminase